MNFSQAHSFLCTMTHYKLIDWLRVMMTRMPSFVPGVGYMSMCRTSLQTTYMMPQTHWRLWMSGHLWSQRLLSWTIHCQRVLLARDSLVQLGGSLCLGEAVFQTSVFSSSCWHTAIICCNDSRPCRAKDVILILHGYIGLDVISVAGMHVSTFYFYLLK